MVLNPERVRQPPNPFRVCSQLNLCPRVLTPLEPWAEISERLRRNFKLMQYPQKAQKKYAKLGVQLFGYRSNTWQPPSTPRRDLGRW
jgi:hypothetical protein